MMSSSLANRILFFLSILGLLVAGFLFYEYNQPTIACPITGQGCDTVRNSIYASLLGIPIPVWGIMFYIGIMWISLLRTHLLQNRFLQRAQFFGVLSGVIFGTYLTSLEAFVIKAYCIWCLTSFAITLFMLGVKVLSMRKTKVSYD